MGGGDAAAAPAESSAPATTGAAAPATADAAAVPAAAGGPAVKANQSTLYGLLVMEIGEGKLAGQIKLIPWWNGYAYIDDVIVNPQFRGHGVGKALIEAAIQWSIEKRFPGIMLETQDDNVAACKLYDSCGFVLGGFDQYTLKNFKPNEIALFWYLIF